MSSEVLDWMQRVTDRLAGVRFRFVSEKDLQDGIELVLKETGWAYKREYRFDAQNKIDFFLDEVGVGLEVKIDKNLAAVTRQLHRYAQQSKVLGLVLVTSRLRLTNLPERFNDKPVRALWLSGSVF